MGHDSPITWQNGTNSSKFSWRKACLFRKGNQSTLTKNIRGETSCYRPSDLFKKTKWKNGDGALICFIVD